MSEKKLSHSKLTNIPGIIVPPGAQNVTVVNNPSTGMSSGQSAVLGSAPFTIWFVYEGGPAAVFNYSIDGSDLQSMPPGVYPLSAQNEIEFQWQVNATDNPIKFVWVFTSGC